MTPFEVPQRRQLRVRPAFVWLAVALILVAAAVLRLDNVNWDGGQHLHPDERFLIMVDTGIHWPSSVFQYFDTAHSPLNPYNNNFGNFVYGTVPVFLLKLVASVMRRDTYDGALYVGRVLSALADVGSVWLLFLSGRRLYGTRVGLLAAAFLAFSVLGIQLSHFMAVDTFTVLFLMVSFYYCVRLMTGDGARSAIGMGLGFGLALACKLSIGLAPLLIAGAVAVRVIEGWPRGDGHMPNEPHERQARRERDIHAPPTARPWAPAVTAFAAASPGLAMAGGSTMYLASAGTLSFPPAGPASAAPPFDDAIQGRDEDPPAASLVSRRATDIAGVVRQANGTLLWGLGTLLLALASAAVAFRVFQPYAFQGLFQLSPKWLADEANQKAFTDGTVDIPFMLQWAHTTPIIFPVKDIVLYGMGWPLGILGFVATGAALIQLCWSRNWKHLLPVLWIGANLIYVGTFSGKFIRYFYQLYPFLALLAAWLVIWLFDRAGGKRANWGAILGVFVVGATILNAYAFTRIYNRPQSRIAASQWIFDNIPAGKTLTHETWDDALPLNLGPTLGPEKYKGVDLPLYDDDNQAKIDNIVKALSSADYVVISSNRLYASISRIPQRFPVTINYYNQLFAGNLGFQLVRHETSYPSLFGIEIKDDRVMGYQSLASQLQPDEAFTVYDHPDVLIYQKTSDFSSDKVRSLLSSVSFASAQRLNPKQASLNTTRMLLSPADQQADTDGGTWSALFDRASVTNRLPAIAWLFGIELLGLIAFPLAFLALRHLFDGGWLLAKPLGLLLLAYLAWILPSLHIARFGRAEILDVGLIIAAAATISAVLQRKAIEAFVRAHWRRMLAGEAAFLGLFALFLLIRASNPDLWHPAMGGEKPMDFAYFNATLKTSYFPPYDPWFAGGYINYYYFGFVIVGTLVKLLGIVPDVGYNLSVAILPAFTAIGAFSAVSSIVAWKQRSAPLKTTTNALAAVRIPIVAGLLAALLVSIMGNLGDLLLVLDGIVKLGPAGHSSLPAVDGIAGFGGGLGQLVHGNPLPFRIEWWYWNATREVPDVINELPFFTFLYGDLHAHAIGMPYTLLATGAGAGLVLAATQKPETAPRGWRRFTSPVEIAGLLILGLVVGALKPTNTWDFPTYLILTSALLLLAEIVGEGGKLTWHAIWRAMAKSAVVLVLATVLFYPFSKSFTTLYSSVSVWTGPRTDLGPYLIVHGIFLFIISAYLLHEVFGDRSEATLGRLARLFWRHRSRSITAARRVALAPTTAGRRLGLAYTADLIAAFAVVLLVIALLRMWLPLVLAALLGLTAVALFAPGVRSEKRIAHILIGLGLGLSLGTEFIVLQGDVGRMNTVFKLDLQVWALWGMGCAIALYDLFVELRPRGNFSRRLVFGGAGVLIAAGLLYPLAGGIARAHDRFTQTPIGLDGDAYMAVSTWQDQKPIPLKPDYEAINWLEDNVAGTPVILEGRGRLYSWASRISINTGLPTVLGWDWHQTQQRALVGDQDIQRRIGDVTNLYTNPSLPAVTPLLSQYDVRLVYVGPFEQEIYPAAGLDKFKALPAIYEQDGVTIYRVPS